MKGFAKEWILKLAFLIKAESGRNSPLSLVLLLNYWISAVCPLQAWQTRWFLSCSTLCPLVPSTIVPHVHPVVSWVRSAAFHRAKCVTHSSHFISTCYSSYYCHTLVLLNNISNRNIQQIWYKITLHTSCFQLHIFFKLFKTSHCCC